MSELLFEIGCEELPPEVVASGEVQMREAAIRLLADERIRPTGVETFATPRRLAFLATGVPASQEASTEERRGPPVSKAFAEDGSFTAAAVGFARANGVEARDLVRRKTEQGEYLFCVRELPGTPAIEVLPRLLPQIVSSFTFPRTMRWDASGLRFPRPIRWLVALWGSEVLPIRVGELTAERTTYGHRVFHPGPVEVPRADAYEDALRGARVIARRDERRELVRTAATQAAAELDGRPIIHEPVLEEVTDLVEHPWALPGRFDATYLEVPAEVLVVAMESHQRYFPVEDESGELLAGFVVVTNADPRSAATVAAGNERVLRARLEDAVFFFREDLKVPLSARAEQLDGIVFHTGLGTMRDKLLRVGGLLAQMSRWLGLSEEDTDAAYHAADVYKADLLSHLVYEFPELQGVMGREYALRDPELRDAAGGSIESVASAIAEHYLPRFAGDDVPQTAAGTALGLTDRLDTLTGYLGLGLAPTGSEDPFGLRRQATGFVSISLARDARIPLAEAIEVAYTGYDRAGVGLASPEECVERVRGFLVARTEAQLEREGIRRMLIEAAVGSSWRDLPELAARARTLAALHSQSRLHSLAVAHERAYNLSKDLSADAEVDEGLLEHEAERNLWSQVQAVDAIARERAADRDFAGALETLVPLSEVVDVFFDRDRGVLVMDPDEHVRANRLALLKRTANAFGVVADFSVIIPAEVEPQVAVVDREAT